jgi:type IV pilus assembly protein PilQ
MRLKQLLGILTLLLVLSTVGMAASSQLTNVSAAAQGNATVITLHASGAFTHTEYRPTDTLLLIDLSGVSAGKWKELTRNLDLPAVTSYHVLGYTGASGSDVARVEITVAPEAVVDVSQVTSELSVKVTSKNASALKPAAPAPAVEKAVATKPVAPAVKPAVMKTDVAPVHSSSAPVLVSNIGVARGEGSMEIEIEGNGPMTAKGMKLSSPARVVIDIANAIPAGRNKTVSVNSGDIKSIRMGRFQDQPPVTRVVVDMAALREFEIVPNGNKVIVRVREPKAAHRAPASATPSVAAVKPAMAPASSVPVMVAAPKAAISQPARMQSEPATVQAQAKSVAAANTPPANSKEFVMVEPNYHQGAAEPSVNDPRAAAEAAANVIAGNNRTSDSPLLPPVSATMARPAENLAQQQAAAQATPAPARPRYTGEPISVNLKDVDLKDFFRLIHEISGLNIVLDPNVRGTLTLVLDDVPWDQALDLVLANNGLDRKLDGNVLRIATVDTLRKEADALRAKNEAEALSVPKVTITHFLSYAKAADVVPTVKRFLSQRGDVIADARTNSLIIQDIPAVIPEVQRLLTQMDRKTQEVEIEARVIAATRSFARDIGTQVAFGWGNGASAVGGPSSVGTSPNQVGYFTPPAYFTVPGIPAKTAPSTSTTAAAIPFFSNLAANGPTSGLNFVNLGANYRLDAILTAAESRGLLKILSRPRIVTQNNVQAAVRQGVRIPIVTAAQLGGPPTTTYVEAFLRLTVTPQITVENTIFLNIDVENTSPDFGQQVGGNPTLITQQATTSVLVTDGGTVVIGGVIQTQNSVTIQQVPLLGSVPVLGNLFKRRSVSTSTQELLFFVTPKIVQT